MKPEITRRSFVGGIAAFSILGRWVPFQKKAAGVVVVRGLGVDAPATTFRRAFDFGLGKLLGGDLEKAWTHILVGGDPVSVKLDALSPLATTSEGLAVALLESLFARRLNPWQVTVWEQRASNLKRLGLKLKTRQGRVRVVAVERVNSRGQRPRGYSDVVKYSPKWLGESPQPSRFASLLDPPPPTLINMPAAKHHPLVGVDGALLSLALRSVDLSARFLASAETLTRAVCEIWRRSPLAGHTLTVMDATRLVYHGGPVGLPAWTEPEGVLILGTDPVAVDAVALDLIDRRRVAAHLPPCRDAGMLLLERAEQMGLGNSKPRIVEVSLTTS